MAYAPLGAPQFPPRTLRTLIRIERSLTSHCIREVGNAWIDNGFGSICKVPRKSFDRAFAAVEFARNVILGYGGAGILLDGSARGTRRKDRIVTVTAKIETPFSQRLSAAAADTERLLDRLLAEAPCEDEIMRPRRLVEAMRYASLGGGKRIRPFLVIEAAGLFGTPRERALMVGAALECVHCYSLVHDDLPAMDNDDLRRGRPTVHRALSIAGRSS